MGYPLGYPFFLLSNSVYSYFMYICSPEKNGKIGK